MGKIIDLTGQKFERLIVVEYETIDKNAGAMWLCKCNCGNYKVVAGSELRRGRTKSCGCLHNESARKLKFQHGLHEHLLYGVLRNIKQRCSNEKRKDYHRYGGRGIKLCDIWKNDFKSFYDWCMSNGWESGLQIDRIDNDGNYESENCRIITPKQNSNNTIRNHFVTYNNKTQTMSQWSDELNIKYVTLVGRINNYKWSIEKALTTPVIKKTRNRNKN